MRVFAGLSLLRRCHPETFAGRTRDLGRRRRRPTPDVSPLRLAQHDSFWAKTTSPIRTFAFLFVGLAGLLALGCGQGTYPLDIFYEMHYQQTYKSGEPPRLAGVEGAVPVGWIPAPKSTSFNTGQHLFNVNCSICHGQTGKGDGPVVKTMMEKYGYAPIINPPDLRDNSKASIIGILQSVTRPFGPNSVMPPFVKLLTGDEIEAVAEYIVTELGVPVSPTAERAEAKPPAETSIPTLGALQVSVKGDALQFDKDKFEVAAGAEVVLVFSNVSGINQHNWVLVQAGTKDDVASRGTTAGLSSDWIQAGDPDVIANTKLLAAGEIGEARFTAPAPGAYQFVCTFPGHNFTMFGNFVVGP